SAWPDEPISMTRLAGPSAEAGACEPSAPSPPFPVSSKPSPPPHAERVSAPAAARASIRVVFFMVFLLLGAGSPDGCRAGVGQETHGRRVAVRGRAGGERGGQQLTGRARRS